MPYKDPAAKRSHGRAYRAANKIKVLAAASDWRTRNRKHVNEKARTNRQSRAKVDPVGEKRKRRNQWLKHNYGLTLEAYEAMLAGQGFRCASCRDPLKDPLSADLDHCHRTKRVRGVLCRGCNTALGLMREDPKRITGLLTYARIRC